MEVLQESAIGAEKGCPCLPPPLLPGQSARKLQCIIPLVLLPDKHFQMDRWANGRMDG